MSVLVLLGVGVGILIYRRRGHRAIAQRLAALGGRLGVEPHDDKGKVEAALAHLEEVAGVATTVVTEAGADAVRLRRSLDVAAPRTGVCATRAAACSIAIPRPRA